MRTHLKVSSVILGEFNKYQNLKKMADLKANINPLLVFKILQNSVEFSRYQAKFSRILYVCTIFCLFETLVNLNR